MVLAFTGALAGSAASASADMALQKKAKELGIASVQNCQSCHGEKLPKKGASTLNDRGKWLVAEKDKKKAKEVDAAWLKDYVEPKK
jgi:mono/diheme cytochrome c family protein